MTITNTAKFYACKIDERIPDASMEVVIGKCDDIHKDVKNTAICAGATIMCIGKTAMDTGELGLILSKTIIKKAGKAVKEEVEKLPNTVTVRR